ncbi:4-(cytidine 5'-diphospho)-2-C-methyl-D-erythritol kinase [Desulfovermiculus halophilus]|uniref:4-(cytidine 5'-diphospho)-2-C-methyl-D-erythritol kinase n=1 Tax=Desulfovermiculus halophilus TaxID=339722 RepID=UPI000A01AA33|nr:4-(cytidine 5'-diphospho)-2-C-methyl-D-erythritol kinase [Desulfovermiculus halophilus]
MSSSEPHILHAGCKVNIYLRIVGTRPDGYHELRSLFLPLADPRDELYVTRSEAGPGLVLECTSPGLSGGNNILHRAFDVFAGETGWRPGVQVRLEKNIPQGAGLGGGSSDAAALLTHLNAQCPRQMRLGEDKLIKAAAEVGADVPFFLQHSPAWVTGIGERVEPVNLAWSSGWLLTVCPDVQVQTAWAYAAWDREVGLKGGEPWLTRGEKPDKGSACAAGRVLYNSFERVVFTACPELRDLKLRLLQYGAKGAVLSGSGAALVGLFTTEQECRRAGQGLENDQTKVFAQAVDPCWGVAKW